ncbi:olfactory receptor 6F1-like [Lissotriton helveticus]
MGKEINICMDPTRFEGNIFQSFEMICCQVSDDLKSNSKKKEKRAMGWFDKECSKAHCELYKALKKIPRDKQEVASLRQKYKANILRRKNEIKRRAWEDLYEKATLRDSAKFWKIVNTPLFNGIENAPLEVNIPERDWLEHFQNIYGSNIAVGPQDQQLIETDEVLDSFTIKEVQKAIEDTAGMCNGFGGACSQQHPWHFDTAPDVRELYEPTHWRNGTVLTNFILLGFSVTPELRTFLFSIVLVTYILSIVTNITIIVIIIADHHLHKPMYFFIGNFSFLEIWYPTFTVPKLMAILKKGSTPISFSECIAQMDFHFSLGMTENICLAIMAFDRCMAIGNPLHYTTNMNNRVCLIMVLGAYGASFTVFSFLAVYVSNLNFCGSNEIDHYYCDIAPLIKLSCTDTFFIKNFFLTLATTVILSCFLVIMTSYVFILSTILKFRTTEGRSKAFSTCASHFTVVFIFYGTIIFMFVRPTRSSSQMNKIASVFPSVVTPLLNPLIYSLRNKEVKDALRRDTLRKKLMRSHQHQKAYITMSVLQLVKGVMVKLTFECTKMSVSLGLY